MNGNENEGGLSTRGATWTGAVGKQPDQAGGGDDIGPDRDDEQAGSLTKKHTTSGRDE